MLRQASRWPSSTSCSVQPPRRLPATPSRSRRHSIVNTLVAVAIAPFGVGDELAPEVAEVVRVIRESGLPNKTYSMFTEIEGEWDEVMAVVRNATFVLAQKGIRTEVILKADVRPGFENMMEQKVRSVDAILESDVADGDAEKGE
ncbi:MAG: thiamine-binding protein [Senegalimassilia sp.]|nr:thiamine-binding protein [Senegalimassilia sp.]